MQYELFVGLRYLRARRSERFISLLTVISILGVMIAVVTLNLAIAVMTGFEEVFRDRLLSLNAHVVLVKPGSYLTGYDELASRLEKRDDVTTAAPALTGQIILTSERRVSGAIVRGIDPDRAPVDLEKFLQQGRMSDLKTSTPVVVNGRDLRLPGIIIGDRLANQLRVRKGDALQAVSPIGSPTAVGLIPRIKRFAVVGIFDSGMREYDAGLVFLNLPDAQGFFGFGKVATSIEITVDDVGKAQGIAEEIQSAVGRRYLVEDWSRLWPNLFAALRLEKTVYFLVLLLMVLIAAFNIISTLMMMVTDKQADIAVLRTLGASRNSIMKIFIIQGTTLGITGIALGVVGGVWLAGNIDVIVATIEHYLQVKFLSPDVYYISELPSDLYWGDVLVTSVAAFLFTVMATIYPAWRAARTQPAEVLRYE